MLGDGVKGNDRMFRVDFTCRGAVLRAEAGFPDPMGGRRTTGGRGCVESQALPHWRRTRGAASVVLWRSASLRGRSLAACSADPRRGTVTYADPRRPAGPGGFAPPETPGVRHELGAGWRATRGCWQPHAPRPRPTSSVPGDGRPGYTTLGEALERSLAVAEQSDSDGARRSRRLKASLRGRPLAGGRPLVSARALNTGVLGDCSSGWADEGFARFDRMASLRNRVVFARLVCA
jgi:hypothetical protein